MKERLTRDKIVAAGLDVIREHGEAALSMRRVASELGAGTMSLYRHVHDRDDLMGGMLDAMALSLTHPPPHEDPVEELVAIVTTVHDLFMREPWLMRVVVEKRRGSPHILPLLERIFVALNLLATSDEEVVRLYFLLMHYCYGDVLSKVAFAKFMAGGPEAGPGPPDFSKYPAMVRGSMAAQKVRNDFEFNLRRVLDAVRASLDHGRPG